MAIKPRRIKAAVTEDYLNAYHVKNNSGADIAAGKVVYVWQADGAFQEVWLAGDGYEPGKVMLVTSQLIPDGGVGVARKMYVLDNVNTSAATSVGDPVYVAASGGWALSGTQQIGQVMVKSATVGKVLLAPCCFSTPASGTVSTDTLEATTVTVKSGGTLNIAGSVLADATGNTTTLASGFPSVDNKLLVTDRVLEIAALSDSTAKVKFSAQNVKSATTTTYLFPGGLNGNGVLASRAASSGGSTITDNAGASETVAVSQTIPASSLTAGDLLRITAAVRGGTASGANTAQYKLRIGNTTLTGQTLVDAGAITNTNGDYTVLEAVVRIQQTGSATITWKGSFQSETGPVANTLSCGIQAGAFSTASAVLVELTHTWGSNSTDTAVVDIFSVEVL